MKTLLDEIIRPNYIGIFSFRHFDVRLTSYKNYIVGFEFRIQKYPMYQFLARSSQYPAKYTSFFTFPFNDTFITKVATPENNEN